MSELAKQIMTLQCRLEVSQDTLEVIRSVLKTAESDIDQLKAENQALRAEAAKWKNESVSDSQTIHSLSCNLAQRTGEVRELAGVVDDLSALIKRFVQHLRKAAPGNALPEQALDYLKRKGLTGSPMRTLVELRIDPKDQQAANWTSEDEASSKLIYEQWANLLDYVPWVAGGNSLKQDEARRMHAAIEGKGYCYGR